MMSGPTGPAGTVLYRPESSAQVISDRETPTFRASCVHVHFPCNRIQAHHTRRPVLDILSTTRQHGTGWQSSHRLQTAPRRLNVGIRFPRYSNQVHMFFRLYETDRCGSLNLGQLPASETTVRHHRERSSVPHLSMRPSINVS